MTSTSPNKPTAPSHSFEIITDENIIEYALCMYDNPTCRGYQEFDEDLNAKPKWIKRLLRRYDLGGEIKERLIMNHIIGFINVFGIEATNKILFFKLEPSLHSYLKTFLVYLNSYRPDLIMYYNPAGIQIDTHIESILKQIQ